MLICAAITRGGTASAIPVPKQSETGNPGTTTQDPKATSDTKIKLDLVSEVEEDKKDEEKKVEKKGSKRRD